MRERERGEIEREREGERERETCLLATQQSWITNIQGTKYKIQVTSN